MESMLTRYEYKVIARALPAALNAKKYDEIAKQLEQEMNALGLEGWELVQWKNGVMIFKRDL